MTRNYIAELDLLIAKRKSEELTQEKLIEKLYADAFYTRIKEVHDLWEQLYTAKFISKKDFNLTLQTDCDIRHEMYTATFTLTERYDPIAIQEQKLSIDFNKGGDLWIKVGTGSYLDVESSEAINMVLNYIAENYDLEKVNAN